MITLMFWNKLRSLVFGFFIVLILALTTSYLFFGDDLSTEALRVSIESFGIWAPFIFVVAYIIGTIFIPSTPLMIVAGLLFGFKYGFIYTLIGGLISSFIVFEVSRRLGKNWVDSILEHKYLFLLHRYNQRLEGGAIWDLVVLRILPIMPFNILNILMGISRISIRNYIAGTTLGLLPSNIITVYLGVIITKIF